jgi:hypothetical protein
MDDGVTLDFDRLFGENVKMTLALPFSTTSIDVIPNEWRTLILPRDGTRYCIANSSEFYHLSMES